MHRRQGLISKVTSGIALAIGLSPVISRANEAMSGGGWQNFGANVAYDYSGGASQGHFSTDTLVRTYGPLLGAIVFKKAISYLVKTAKLKI